jgi:hypothetical protein
MDEYSKSSESEKLLEDYTPSTPLHHEWLQSSNHNRRNQQIVIIVLSILLLLTNTAWFWSTLIMYELLTDIKA